MRAAIITVLAIALLVTALLWINQHVGCRTQQECALEAD